MIIKSMLVMTATVAAVFLAQFDMTSTRGSGLRSSPVLTEEALASLGIRAWSFSLSWESQDAAPQISLALEDSLGGQRVIGRIPILTGDPVSSDYKITVTMAPEALRPDASKWILGLRAGRAGTTMIADLPSSGIGGLFRDPHTVSSDGDRVVLGAWPGEDGTVRLDGTDRLSLVLQIE